MTLEEIAADKFPGGGTPVGFLPASALGLQPETDEYRTALSQVLKQTQAHSTALGVSGNAAAEFYLVRYHAAEAVLTRAKTGSVKDPSGASVSLSGSDLQHWRDIKEAAMKNLEKVIPTKKSMNGGVYLTRIEIGK